MVSISKFVKKPPVTIAAGATIFEAAELMDRTRVGAIIVMEGEKLAGVLSERDIVRRVVLKKKDLMTTKVSEVMTTSVKTAMESTTSEQAFQLMHQGEFRHLPILGADGKVIGMLSVTDLMRQRIEELSSENKDLAAYIYADGPGG